MEGIVINWRALFRPEYGWRILGLIITWVIVWLADPLLKSSNVGAWNWLCLPQEASKAAIRLLRRQKTWFL